MQTLSWLFRLLTLAQDQAICGSEMRIFAEVLWIPKAGSSTSEYEDAYCPKHPIKGEPNSRFAVADGATETSFSGIWAKQLVRAYCEGLFDSPNETEWLVERQKRWWTIARKKPLPWYAEQKLESGTFAAFVGITLCYESVASESGTWHAAEIGRAH